jgi:hypothetical protein
MKNLKISSTLTLSVDAVTQKLAMLGRTGSGKSYGATKLAEEMLDAGAQIVALDPVGIWYGLRTGYSIPVFGGLHGDIPLEVGGGALIADLIVDRRISAVVDVSQFESDADKARFARDFAARFYFRQKQKPSPVHLFLEEAQEFVPQNPEKEEGWMLHAFVRIAKLGRNFGIGMTQLSQRPQEVNKKALNQTECLFAFQMTGSQERDAIAKWATSKGVDENLDEILPSLEVGQAHVWSPQWLRISRTVKIAKKKTADVSSTPQVGAKPIKAKDLRPVDLEALREKMAATIERERAENPKELRAQIVVLKREKAELEKKVAKAPTTTVEEKKVEIAVLKTKDANKLESASKRLQEVGVRVAKIGDDLIALIRKAIPAPDGSKLILERGTATVAQPAPSPRSKIAIERTVAALHAPKPAPTPAPAPGPATLMISGPMQKILNTLASFEALGVQECDRNQVAIFSGASPTSSSFANNLSDLKNPKDKAGGPIPGAQPLIEYPKGGRLKLTDAGRAVAVNETVFASLDQLQSTWIAKVGGACGKILAAAIAAYPNPITKTDLAAQVQVSETSSSFANNLSTLRTLGVIDYPGKGLVVATPILFPPI